MEKSFHVTKKAEPGRCRAKPGNCPFGNVAHFDSKEATQDYLEKANALESHPSPLSKGKSGRNLSVLEKSPATSEIKKELQSNSRDSVTPYEKQTLEIIDSETPVLNSDNYKSEALRQHQQNREKFSLLKQGFEARGYEVHEYTVSEEDSKRPPYPQKGREEIRVKDPQNKNNSKMLSNVIAYNPPKYSVGVPVNRGEQWEYIENGSFSVHQDHPTFGMVGLWGNNMESEGDYKDFLDFPKTPVRN